MKAFFVFGCASVLLVASMADQAPPPNLELSTVPNKLGEQIGDDLGDGGVGDDDIGDLGGVGGLGDVGDVGDVGGIGGVGGLGGGYRALRGLGDEFVNDATNIDGDDELVVGGKTVVRRGVVVTPPRRRRYY